MNTLIAASIMALAIASPAPADEVRWTIAGSYYNVGVYETRERCEEVRSDFLGTFGTRCVPLS